ncbi:hypothetical protein AR543_p0128 (plasmid) [Paenibacillus bovis]|uniref:Uncharacterized protein n=1 Tax=Paenibacillus bovis TaxID=1616788 RepID=A0A1X9T4E2_9BACL|nr:hypothetical protein AR543_p0128 [Paenibacillus bovis]
MSDRSDEMGSACIDLWQTPRRYNPVFTIPVETQVLKTGLSQLKGVATPKNKHNFFHSVEKVWCKNN